MIIALKSFCRKLLSFAADRRANVAITFAFASIPVIALVGAAIDYSRANQLKAAMQTAVDGTALMLSKEAATDTPTRLQQDAAKYFIQLLNRPDISSDEITVGVVYSTDGGPNIVVNATAKLPAEFIQVLNLIGSDFHEFTVKASSTAKWGITRLRVALVLDNTGSMADNGKMAALQGATQKLLQQLQAAVTTAGDVYVSIIPFVKDVNVGTGYYNADWVYWGTSTQDPTYSDNASWDAINGVCSSGGYSPRSQCFANVGTCSVSGYTTQTSCINSGVCSISGYTSQNSCTNAGVCSKAQYTTKTQCRNNGGTWTSGVWTSNNASWTPTYLAWTPKNHHTYWNGCVMDRGYPASPSNLGGNSGPDTTYNYDTNSVSPDPVTPRWSSLYAAEQYGSCPQAVMGLSYDWSSMSNLVSNMSPAGNTNQALGLQLGWMSLVGGGPFMVPPLDPLYQYTQVIILLTDGLNTQNRWYTAQSSIDARQKTTCDNINAGNVTLYTIQVNTSGDPTSTLLQNCAGTAPSVGVARKYPDTGKFFTVTSSSGIGTVFNQIATQLSQLRIAM
jgi:Flp pilus assembly protein TadG